MHSSAAAFARKAGKGSERRSGRGAGTSTRQAGRAEGERGRGHDEYFMPQSQTFSLTPEQRAQHFLVFVTVARNVATGKPGWAPLAEKEPQPMLRLLMQKGAVGPAGPERGLHGSVGTRRHRTAHTGGQGSLCPR